MTRLAARVTDGVAQADRTPEALEDGYFLPQERRLHDHIALLRQLSRHVRAVDRNGVDAGSWRPLFDGEIAVAMARLIAAPSEPRRSAFASALRRDPAEAAALLRALALELRDFAAAVARSGDATLAMRHWRRDWTWGAKIPARARCSACSPPPTQTTRPPWRRWRRTAAPHPSAPTPSTARAPPAARC